MKIGRFFTNFLTRLSIKITLGLFLSLWQILKGKSAWKEVNEYDKMSVAMNIGHINHIRARKLLFKLMEQNIEKWWD